MRLLSEKAKQGGTRHPLRQPLWTLSFLAARATRSARSHDTLEPRAPEGRDWRQGQEEDRSQSPGVSRVTGSENSPATALLQAFTRKFMYFMSNLRPGMQQREVSAVYSEALGTGGMPSPHATVIPPPPPQACQQHPYKQVLSLRICPGLTHPWGLWDYLTPPPTQSDQSECLMTQSQWLVEIGTGLKLTN